MWKRILDVLLVLVASPVVVPIAILIAAAIKLSSSGPILFRQERVGHLGKPFTLFKFRTMKVGADSGVHANHLNSLIATKAPLTKIDAIGDTRLVPFGRILRATGLDELPQLLNVLKSEMSLVGPRPCMPYERDTLTPHQHRRFGALPGITGLWQTSGKNRTTFEEMINLDITYVYEKSIVGDVIILLRTFPVVVAQAIESVNRRRAQKAQPFLAAKILVSRQ